MVADTGTPVAPRRRSCVGAPAPFPSSTDCPLEARRLVARGWVVCSRNWV
jgi:hypothetical protein